MKTLFIVGCFLVGVYLINLIFPSFWIFAAILAAYCFFNEWHNKYLWAQHDAREAEEEAREQRLRKIIREELWQRDL